MRQAELLSRLVLTNELPPTDPMLREEYLDAHTSEWTFLREYYALHGVYPNKATFLTQFPHFDFVDTEVTAQWLADEVAQDFLGLKVSAAMGKVLDAAGNPRASIDVALDEFRKLLAYTSVHNRGIDLFDTAPRIEEALRRRNLLGLSGITNGLDLLDEVTQGTQPGEIEIYYARPGMGKSLILLYGAYAAARSGYDVAMFSPEMSSFEMGARLDSMQIHSSSSKFMAGNVDADEIAEYQMHVQAHRDTFPNLPPIRFFEPTMFGRAFTTADVHRVALNDQPALICIDGLMLLEPAKADKDPRKRIINIMTELKEITTTTGIPLRLAHQANRESVLGRRVRNTILDDVLPQLSHMAESGSVEQYANRAFALTQLGPRFFMAVRKNRNGPQGRFVSFRVDIDTGRYTEHALEDSNTDLAAPSTTDVVERDTF